MKDLGVDFRKMFFLLRDWFDGRIDASSSEESSGYNTAKSFNDWPMNIVTLKTWWPKYTSGDFRFELCIGVLLVHRVAWPQVRNCIRNLDAYLRARGMPFEAEALLTIPVEDFESLVNASRFPKQKTWRIRKFCDIVKSGGLEKVLAADDLPQQLTDMKSGFGKESRDTVLLYAANRSVFIADAYARKLLRTLDVLHSDNYDDCQHLFQEGILRDFDPHWVNNIVAEYQPDQLRFVLCNPSQTTNVPLMLLYQQFHGGIVELGKSKRWEEFRASLSGDI